MSLGSTPMSVWAADILAALGAPHTKNNVNNLAAWNACEGSNANFNPFNTTLPSGNAPSINSAGVRSYSDYQQGLAATVSTLKQPNMSAIAGALRSDVPRAQFAAAVGGSPWGTNGGCVASSTAAAGLAAGTGAGAGLAGNGNNPQAQTTAATQAFDQATCLWSFPGVTVPLLGNVGQFCWFTKSADRGLNGGILMLLGAVGASVGVAVILIAVGLRSRPAEAILGAVPGGVALRAAAGGSGRPAAKPEPAAASA